MNRPNRVFAAWIGYLVDVYRIVAFRFSNPHSLIKYRQIGALRRRTGAKMFVESGTFKGVTAARCARLFERVYTVELDDRLYEEAKAYLASFRNVETIHGDASREIPRLFAAGRATDALVFLDGHYSGSATACGDSPEPAIEELEALARYREQIRGIIIDDFRNFGVEPGYPKKSGLLAAFEKHYEPFGYQVQVHLDQVLIFKA